MILIRAMVASSGEQVPGFGLMVVAVTSFTIMSRQLLLSVCTVMVLSSTMSATAR